MGKHDALCPPPHKTPAELAFTDSSVRSMTALSIRMLRANIWVVAVALFAISLQVLTTIKLGSTSLRISSSDLLLPVLAVATDVGDAREIIGDTGLIVPPGDSDALATAINRLLEEPEESRLRRRERVRDRIVKNYSLETAVKKFDRLYNGET